MHGNPLQYSCLENSMDRGAWRATVHEAAQRWTRLKWLSSSRVYMSMLLSQFVPLSSYSTVSTSPLSRFLSQIKVPNSGENAWGQKGHLLIREKWVQDLRQEGIGWLCWFVQRLLSLWSGLLSTIKLLTPGPWRGKINTNCQSFGHTTRRPG